jgi:uncharacterized protein (AIM24 family)
VITTTCPRRKSLCGLCADASCLRSPTTPRSNENLKLYTPPQDTPATLFQIIGSDYSQVVEINLAPGMTASFEPGTMMHMSDHIEPVANVGDLGQACTRMCCLSENFFRLNLTNTSDANQSLALTPAFPAKVVPVDLQVYPGGLFIKDHVFLGALGVDWTVHVRMVRSLGAGCFGGQGFFLNLLQGSSWAFLAAGGTVLEKHLAPDEVLLCDPSAVVAFEPSVGYSIQRVQGCVTCCFGGMYAWCPRAQRALTPRRAKGPVQHPAARSGAGAAAIHAVRQAQEERGREPEPAQSERQPAAGWAAELISSRGRVRQACECQGGRTQNTPRFAKTLAAIAAAGFQLPKAKPQPHLPRIRPPLPPIRPPSRNHPCIRARGPRAA